MKKTLITLIIACLVLSLSAQEDTLTWKQTLQRHDIQIGIGDPLVAGILTDRFPIFDKCGGIFSKCSDNNWRTASDWFSPDVYSTGVIATPTFSVGYKYRFAKWFWFGASVSYTGFYETKYDRISNQKYSSNNLHYITIVPEVRFSWLNKKYVTLYSGIGIGVGLFIDDTYYSNKFFPNGQPNYDEVTWAPTGQLTFVGVHVGRKWYGFTEIGVGCKGIIQAGFGYNFNSKKKNKQ